MRIYMKTVCIESPFSGDFTLNLAYARACMLHCLRVKNVAPFASHLLYPQVLDDRAQDHREMGLAASLVMGDRCEERWFFIDFGMSLGMTAAWDRTTSNHQQSSRQIHLGDSWRTKYAPDPTPGF